MTASVTVIDIFDECEAVEYGNANREFPIEEIVGTKTRGAAEMLPELRRAPRAAILNIIHLVWELVVTMMLDCRTGYLEGRCNNKLETIKLDS